MRTERPRAVRFVETEGPQETIAELESELRKDLPEYDTAMGQYRDLLEESTKQFAGLLQQANDDLKRSVGEAKEAMEKQILASRKQIEAAKPEPKGAPESAWVKDHLVLNREAVNLIDTMFTQFQAVLKDLAKQ